jgi:hypothetical protein
MKTIKMLLLLLALAPAAAFAAGDQIYFLGYAAPKGSISQAGAGERATWLRWDVVQGEPPADVAAYRLYKDGALLEEWPAGYVMPAPELAALYARPENARRQAEMLDRLRRSDASLAGLTAGTMPNEIVRRLNDANSANPSVRKAALAWVHLASRMDPLVAIARGRAFLDDAPGGGVATYRLVAVNGAGIEASLGEMAVDRGAPKSPAAAAGFRQALDIGRCDAPDDARSHGAVALDWNHAGASAAEQYANSLNIAGYDLYRTTGDCAAAAPRDLRAEAAGRTHDAAGRVSLPGLVRVNDQPIAISGRPADGREKGAIGYNPEFSQWLDDPETLRKAGVEPGDGRCYYLVARDLTGNYGDTAALRAVVGDTRRPPAPSAIEPFPESKQADADDRMVLRFDHLDVPNFRREHDDGRTWCNLESAVAEKRLTYTVGGSCSTGAPIDVALDVAGYVVYRFETEYEANTFLDTDGDGRADAAERETAQVAADDPRRKITRPGTACDPLSFPLGAKNYRRASFPADAAHVVVADGGRKVVEWVDDQPDAPQLHKGTAYWYRVAAVSATGRVGDLGPPVRVSFPDEAKPDRPEVAYGVCDYYAYIGDTVQGIHAVDYTRDAVKVRFYCEAPAQREPTNQDGQGDAVIGQNQAAVMGIAAAVAPAGAVLAAAAGAGALGARVYVLEIPLLVLSERVPGIGQINESQCATLARFAPNCALHAEFVNKDGRVLASVPVPSGDRRFACGFTAYMDKDCERGFHPVAHGDVVEGPLVIKDPGVPECASIFQEIDGTDYRLGTVCPGQWPFTYDPPNLGGESLCLTMTLHSKTNVTSTDLELPCVKIPAKGPPEPPKLANLAFPGGPAATLTWYAPERPSAGIIAEWKSEAPGFLSSSFYSAAGVFGTDHAHTAALPITPDPAPGTSESWCVRARTVAIGLPGTTGTLSEWTPWRCATRQPPGVTPPEYLPWPAVPSPGVTGAPLQVALLPGDNVPSILLGNINVAALGGDERCTALNESVPGCDGREACAKDDPFLSSCPGFCNAVRSGLGNNVRFTVYRQLQQGAAEPGPFSQVTPLLDTAFCATYCTGNPIPAALIGGVGRPPRDAELNRIANVQPAGDAVLAANNDAIAAAIALPPRGCVQYVSDPHIKLLDLAAQGWPSTSLVWVDRFPLIAGASYRYQLVYFDERGEILGRRETAWIAVP